MPNPKCGSVAGNLRHWIVQFCFVDSPNWDIYELDARVALRFELSSLDVCAGQTCVVCVRAASAVVGQRCGHCAGRAYGSPSRAGNSAQTPPLQGEDEFEEETVPHELEHGISPGLRLGSASPTPQRSFRMESDDEDGEDISTISLMAGSSSKISRQRRTQVGGVITVGGNHAANLVMCGALKPLLLHAAVMDKKASPCRCDGKDPCGPCSRARTAVICNYTNTPTTVYVSELRKGAACSACRRKKKVLWLTIFAEENLFLICTYTPQKCSGDWPCLACVAARKKNDCKFDDGSQLSSTRALIERARELEKLLSQAKQMTPDILDYQLDPSVSNELDQLGFASDPVSLTIREDAEAVASSNEAGPSDPTFLKPVSFDLVPVTAGNPNLGVSLGVVPNLGVRTETEEEKLFRLSVLFLKSLPPPPLNLPTRRALFLQKAPTCGFSLSLRKLDAIAKGDMTGLVVHPVLIHVCHLWGYLLDFLQQTGTSGSFNGMFGPAPNPVTSLLTYLTVSVYFFQKGQLDRGQEFLAIASKTALEHDIDLACLGNVYSHKMDQEFSVFPNNDDDEMRAAFSLLIYLGTVPHLLLNNPRVVAARLMDTFSLLMSTQVATHVDVVFMTAKSVRLFAETRQLTSVWNGSASSQSPPTLWFDRYWKLIEQIHSHIGRLQPAVLKVSFIPDYHTTELALKHAMILTLAALTDLHAIFAPSHLESSRRYRDALTEIVSISSTFASDDFQYLGPILSLCWTVATQGILENRIVYENQNSIITAIRQCNQNLKQALVDLNDLMYTI
ncbi:hypothetical protein C8J57DRAFT_1225229 [Mycena rebaudengoi]|nr:hypothetical protein C8J57DRAFT_1225229 [Mycena rebaudengoi]